MISFFSTKIVFFDFFVKKNLVCFDFVLDILNTEMNCLYKNDALNVFSFKIGCSSFWRFPNNWCSVWFFN